MRLGPRPIRAAGMDHGLFSLIGAETQVCERPWAMVRVKMTAMHQSYSSTSHHKQTQEKVTPACRLMNVGCESLEFPSVRMSSLLRMFTSFPRSIVPSSRFSIGPSQTSKSRGCCPPFVPAQEHSTYSGPCRLPLLPPLPLNTTAPQCPA